MMYDFNFICEVWAERPLRLRIGSRVPPTARREVVRRANLKFYLLHLHCSKQHNANVYRVDVVMEMRQRVLRL